MTSHKPKILLIYTGGTIGMVKDFETGALKAFDFNELLSRIPELHLLDCQIETISFDVPIDSSNMNISNWQKMAKIIEENYSKFDGFVVLHGSDTMSYSASALSFMLEDLAKPVIFTGSQLPIGDLRTDAKENLITAIQVASLQENKKPVIQEVCLYFEYKLYRGNRTTKISAEHFNAFTSPNFPELAESGVHLKVEEAMLYRTHHQEDFSVDLHLNDSILLWRIFPGINLESLPQIPKIKVLILQVFGSGTIFSNKKTEEVLQKIRNNGTEIVVISQCVSGGISIGKYNNSNIFKKIGAISGHDITAESALAKAMHLIDNPNYSGDFAENFKKNLRGEISEIEE